MRDTTNNQTLSSIFLQKVHSARKGIWKLNQTREKESIFDDSEKEVEFVDFTGKGKYSEPEFVWDKPVAPTA